MMSAHMETLKNDKLVIHKANASVLGFTKYTCDAANSTRGIQGEDYHNSFFPHII